MLSHHLTLCFLSFQHFSFVIIVVTVLSAECVMCYNQSCHPMYTIVFPYLSSKTCYLISRLTTASESEASDTGAGDVPSNHHNQGMCYIMTA